MGRGSARCGRSTDCLERAIVSLQEDYSKIKAWATSRRRALRALSDAPLQVDLAGPERYLHVGVAGQALRSIVNVFLPAPARWDPRVYGAELGVHGLSIGNPGGEGRTFLPADPILYGFKGVTPRSLKRRYRVDKLEIVLARLRGLKGHPKASGASLMPPS